MVNLLDTLGGTGPFGLNARLMIPLIYSAVLMFVGPAFLSIIFVEWLSDRFGSARREPEVPERHLRVLRPEEKPAPPEKKRAA